MAAVRPMANFCLRGYCRAVKSLSPSFFTKVNKDVLNQQRFFHVGAISLKPRKRYQWRRDKPAANTQLAAEGEEQLETRRTYGGRSKVKAVFKNTGSYCLKSQDIELQAPILDVVYSECSNDHVKRKIMTKGSIVQIDATEFKDRLDSLLSAKSSEADIAGADNTGLDSDSKDEHQPESTNTSCLDESLQEIINTGKLYGRITTRPGQVGLCDGYILEGAELQKLMEKLAITQPQ